MGNGEGKMWLWHNLRQYFAACLKDTEKNIKTANRCADVKAEI